jgi:HEAT repeat protein
MLITGRHRLHAGRANQVATLVLAQPKKISQLIECLWDEDAGVANRAADALERATFHQPSLAEPWKDALLGLIAEAEQNKLRWNLALFVPRLQLSVPEAQRAAAALRTYLEDKSSIVKTAAMHGLADLTHHDPSLRPEVLDMLRILSRSGTPAMRARGRILLKKLETRSNSRRPTDTLASKELRQKNHG